MILLMEQRGVEPLTSALRTRRSAKLSYCPTRCIDNKNTMTNCQAMCLILLRINSFERRTAVGGDCPAVCYLSDHTVKWDFFAIHQSQHVAGIVRRFFEPEFDDRRFSVFLFYSFKIETFQFVAKRFRQADIASRIG